MTDDRSLIGGPADLPGRQPDGRPDASPEVRTMAAGVAHEFNNLLGAILVSAEEALEAADSPEVKRFLRVIIDRVDAACVVTANLLSFACQDFIEPRPADLVVLLDDALVLMAECLRSAGVAVIRDFQDIGPVDVDPMRLERVFLNLFANAVEAMTQPGGRLTVSLLRDGDRAVVRISDTGHGIPPEFMPRVFEPFVTTKGVLGGGDTSALGLGLCVCQGIVRMHRGAITLDSTPGCGTTVTVTLPLKAADNGRGGCGGS